MRAFSNVTRHTAKPVKKTHMPYCEWSGWVNDAPNRSAQFRADLASALTAQREGRTLTFRELAALAQHEGR